VKVTATIIWNSTLALFALITCFSHLSNNDNSFWHNGAWAHHSHYNVTYLRSLRSHIPEFIEPVNWSPGSPDIDPMDYSVWGAFADGVSSQYFGRWNRLKCMLIDCLTQLSQDTLNPVLHRLPKILMMVIKMKGAYVESCLD